MKQFAQYLVWWPGDMLAPIVKYTWASNPLAGAKKSPDATYESVTGDKEVIVYYWGEPRPHVDIIALCLGGKIQW